MEKVLKLPSLSSKSKSCIHISTRQRKGTFFLACLLSLLCSSLLCSALHATSPAMNGAVHQQQGDSSFCFFHPRDLVVGVCAHCLRDRLLLVLSSSSKHAPGARARARSPTGGASYLSSRPYYRALRRRTGSISLPKVFALGSFLQRLDSSRHHRPPDADDVDNNSAAAADDDDGTASVASLDDSFISIKFEDNGKATWDSQLKAKIGGEAANLKPALRPTTTAAVVEHVKRGGVTRWRKQVLGRLLQLARWKRSAKQAGGAAAACHVVDQRQKGRAGGRSWIRSLTRRRAAHGERAWS